MGVSLARRGAVAASLRRGGAQAAAVSIFTSQTPSSADNNDAQALTVATRFTSTAGGTVTGVRFYRAVTAPTSVIGLLYTEAGTELARVTFGAFTTGWNTATFATPVSVTSGATYRVAYWSSGPYVNTGAAFPVTNGVLTANAGFFGYGASPAFPTSQFNNANYFADVLFVSGVAATVPATPLAPTVAGGDSQVVVSWAAPADGGSAITGYDVQQFVGATAGAVTSVGVVLTTTVTGLTNGTAYTFKVRAKNAVGNGSYSSASAAVTPSLLPSLVPWEGGPAYYASYSQATASGMTSDTFFPLLVDFESVTQQSDITADLAYGVNGYYRLTSDSSMTLIRNAGMIAFPGPGQSGVGNETVGWNVDDEVDMWAGPGWNTWNGLYPGQGGGPTANSGYDVMSQLTSVSGPQGPAVADGRMKHMNYGKGVVFWESLAESRVFVNGGTSGAKTFSLDAVSADLYFYTDRNTGREDDPTNAEALLFLQIPNGQIRRAANYGMHVVKRIRDDLAAQGRYQPVYGFVEIASQGNLISQASYTDNMIEGAVWSCLIFEARGIIYFVHDFVYSGDAHNLRNNIGGHTARVTALNARITALAPVLNTQSYAVTYNSTVDAMTKRYNSSWYIFAMSKRQATHDTTSRTFTLHSQQTGTQVEVVNESRTLSITGGTFTDSFAAEYTCHIYKII